MKTNASSNTARTQRRIFRRRLRNAGVAAMPRFATIPPILLIAFCLSARAQIVQFHASDGWDANTATWISSDGKHALSPSHAEFGGISHAARSDRAIWFGESTSPLEFPPDDTGTVKRVWMVLDTGGNALPRMSSILCAPNALRVDAQDATRFQTEFRGLQNSLEIDGVESDKIPEHAGFFMLELGFSVPVERRSLFLGGSPAFLDRGFTGCAAHIIMTDRELEPEESGAIRKLLSAMYGISIPAQAGKNTAEVLKGLNIKDYGYMATILIVR